MTDLQTRLAQLRERGWQLVQERAGGLEPVADQPGMFREREGAYVLERIRPFKGSVIREVGNSLRQAVAAAEWQEDRLSQFEGGAVPIQTGVMPHTTTKGK